MQYTTKTGGLRNISRRALYVALSRATSLSRVYIDGEFKAPDPPGPDDKAVLEMAKLRNRPVIFAEDELLDHSLPLHDVIDVSKFNQAVQMDLNN